MSQLWDIQSADNIGPNQRLPSDEVREQLETGLLAGDDLIRSDAGNSWQEIENHPTFRDLVQQIEESHRRVETDETRLDMNPLIDVSLVLLIFFILTALRNLALRPSSHRSSPLHREGAATSS